MSEPSALSSFALLQSTLAAELQAEELSRCTKNFFVRTCEEFTSTLVSVVGKPNLTSPLLVFSDGVAKKSGIKSADADELMTELFQKAGIPAQRINLSQLMSCSPSDVHASVEAVALVKAFLKESFPVPTPVLVLGSGSITDVVKHALHELGWASVPFIVVPTALTVTAFTSHFAVLGESGAKRTRLSRTVDCCFWFAPLLASAPLPMTRAGYGDLLARFVAYGDWYLAWKLGVAHRYDEMAFRLMEPFSFHLRRHAAALTTWPVQADAIEDLCAILAMAGTAMSVSGETTPLSGYEHAISHALDYLRLTSGRPLAWHGQQVALASLASAESFDHLLQMEKIDLQSVRPLSEERIRKIILQQLNTAPYFGPGESSLTPEERKQGLVNLQENIQRAGELFIQDYLKKHALWLEAHAKIEQFEAQWPAVRDHLRTLVVPAAELQQLVQLAGLAAVPEELSQPTTALEYRWALRFAPFVRSRMSLADFIFWLGDDPALWATI